MQKLIAKNKVRLNDDAKNKKKKMDKKEVKGEQKKACPESFRKMVEAKKYTAKKRQPNKKALVSPDPRSKSSVYVLELENNKVYVGKSKDLQGMYSSNNMCSHYSVF